jgi:hypothetical protein
MCPERRGNHPPSLSSCLDSEVHSGENINISDSMADPIEAADSGSWHVVPYAVIILAAALSLLAYRLCLHPLNHVPGPKLAAATSLYEFYHDGCLGGKYYWEIMRMHRKYGTKPAAVSILLLNLTLSRSGGAHIAQRRPHQRSRFL